MIVKNIDFSVNQQTIKFSTAAQLVANSAGIVTASFSFSADWSDYDIIKVIFSNGETKKSKILTTGQYTVTIPSECMTAGRLLVSAVGLSGETGEETFKRATTERNSGVEVVPSGAFEGSPADLPTPTEAEQILLIATNANATATQANETANTANANASAAVTTANTANTNSSTALSVANGIDAKATTALSQSSAAVSTANTASTTAGTANTKAQEALDKFPYVVMGETAYGGTIADNLNAIIKNGFYTCYGGATGAPGAASSWLVIHQNSNAGTLYAHQRAVAYTAELGVWERVKYNGTWQPWVNPLPDTRFKGLRLAKQVIVGAATPLIEVDKYTDGTPLNSTLGGELVFYSGTNVSIAASVNCYMILNGDAGATAYWYRASNGISFLPIGKIGTLYTATTASVKILSGNLIISGINSYKDSTVNGVDTSPGGGMTTPQTAVTAIKIFLSSGTFPAGTVVEWWERG